MMDPGPLFGLIEKQRREEERKRKQLQEGERSPKTQLEQERGDQPNQDKYPQDE